MKAIDTLTKRIDLVEQLTATDETLVDMLRQERSRRMSAEARSLLESRREICEQLRLVGFEPWQFDAIGWWSNECSS
jgi:hypothetical protein